MAHYYLHLKPNILEDLAKMMGEKGEDPKQLPSYQAVNGVLNIQHWETPNGVRVYFVPVPSLPMVDIQISLDAGSARDGTKGGLATITSSLLSEGTPTLNADQIAENFENVGAIYSAQAQRDMAALNLRTLSDPEQLVPAVENLAAILKAPSFPEQNFKRIQKNMLSALKQQQQKPDTIATKAFFNTVYANQPYSNWVYGTEESVKTLQVEDAKAFYKKFYVAKNMVITLVGDLSEKNANTIVKTLTKDLIEGEKAEMLPKVKPLAKKITKKIEFPSTQTHIMMGEAVLKRDDPDYYPLAVGNHILGGNGSVTRIFNIIRNQNGLAYSAYSVLVPMHVAGPFIIGCQTRNDQADKALQLLEQLLAEFIKNGPTQKELEQAKQNLLGGFPLKFDSNHAITSYVSILGFYGLPLNYFDQYKPTIEKITIEDIKSAFQRKISPTDLAIILVGGKGGPAIDSQPGGPPNDVKTLPS